MSTETGFIDFVDMRLNDPTLDGNDGRPRRIDPGEYEFEVADVKIDQSQRGNPTLALSLRVVSEGPMLNRTMRQSYPIIPDNEFCRSRMKTLIEALGVQTDDAGRFAPQALIGCRMIAEVISHTYPQLDSLTGQTVQREGTKLVGERPSEAPAPQPAARQPQAGAQAAPVAQRAAGAAPVAARRVAPAGNGQPAARR